MTILLTIKEKLAKIYARAGVYINHILTFFLAFLSFFIIGQRIGTNATLTSPMICLAMALVCAFLPINATVLMGTLLIIIHLVGMSVELAAIAAIVFIVVYLLYFRFAPKTGFLLILTPILYFLHIPYVVPVIAGLTVGIAGIVPMIAGTFIYYLISFSANYSNAITSLDAEAILQNITFIINNILNNQEMIVIIASFSVSTLAVFLLRKLSVKYNWIIAIGVGCVLDAVIQMIAFSVLSISYSGLWMVLGHIVAFAIGMLLHLFLFSVDYSATEYVQFEDNDYFYYVKAVPKISVQGKQVKVKKINDPSASRVSAYEVGAEMEYDEVPEETAQTAEPEETSEVQDYVEEYTVEDPVPGEDTLQ